MPVGETSGLDFRIGTGMRLPITVGRGPVPRHASVYRKLAGDRPPPYGEKTASCPYRSRAPTFAGDRPPRYGEKRFLSQRGGQAPALR